MRVFLLFACLTLSSFLMGQNVLQKLARLPEVEIMASEGDWLIEQTTQKAMISRKGKQELIMSNGLVSRTFWLSPNVATVSLKNVVSSEEYIRALRPEAELLIDGIPYSVGGLIGQKEHGYLLKERLPDMQKDSNAFILYDYEIKDLEERLAWKKTRWIPKTQWKQSGKELVFYFTHAKLNEIEVVIHYEIYDHLPLLSKWLEVKNKSDQRIVINHFASEIIAHPEKNNFVDIPKQWQRPNFHIENDYAFGGFTYIESNQAMVWETDSLYTSQVNWERQTPVVIKSQPQKGPEYRLQSQESFQSFRTYFLALDGTDWERNSLSLRKMYRTLAPWVTENPIFMHLTTTDVEKVKTAIDQCAETGYEMVILSFGSGLNMEDLSEENIGKFRSLTDYAHGKGIQLGGYSLFSSRRIDDETDVIDIQTGKPGGAKFGGHAPCGGSKWGIDYFKKLEQFITQTGFDMLEHDGPFPGDFCASITHPGHHNYGDSQWKQWRQTTDFYKWLRSQGVYTNIPDFYILSGSNKVGIGYREVNWSLPRAQQIILGRQNIYDGTWLRTPSMGWTFVPLTEYHGGGAAATLEPLSEHLSEYDAHMTQNYGSGVQACYRGPRLYDSEATKALVKRKIKHYKKYRDILNADIIHLRRPDGRDWDGILHVDPALEMKGYALLYNPTKEIIKRRIKLPLYYTGLKDEVEVSIDEGTFQKYELNRAYELELMLEIPAHGNVYVILK